MTYYLSLVICITHILGRVFFAKKYFFAPLYCLIQEGLWIALFLTVDGIRPLLFISFVDIAIYLLAVPKWWREKNDTTRSRETF